jgi:hypothetical protein
MRLLKLANASTRARFALGERDFDPRRPSCGQERKSYQREYDELLHGVRSFLQLTYYSKLSTILGVTVP